MPEDAGDAAPIDSGVTEDAQAIVDADGGAADAADANDAGNANDAADANDANDAGVTPLDVAPKHLRLWLRADRELSCVGGRVTRWADQSSHANDATLQNGQLGPQCGLQGAHASNGVDLPYFSAPSNGNVVDETLDVDLSFLAGSSYTIFVVNRRWADEQTNSTTQGYFLIGTTNPDDPADAPCNSALQVGYVYYNNKPQFVFDQTCSSYPADVPPVPSPPPSPLTRDIVELAASSGTRTVWIDGAGSIPSLGNNALTAAAGGAIGRAFTRSASSGKDGRFHGDIAEVIVYDSALDDADRTALDAYLTQRWRL